VVCGGAGAKSAKTFMQRKPRLEVPKNRLANWCSPKGNLLHPENSCLVLTLSLS
jgi:hypothetical protein